MPATSLSRRALLRRSASLFAVGLAAYGCTDVVKTLYPYMGNDLRMIATNVALLVRSLQSCCDNTDTAPFIADLAAIGNDINGTVSAIWPATASSLSAPAENQILQFAVDELEPGDAPPVEVGNVAILRSLLDEAKAGRRRNRAERLSIVAQLNVEVARVGLAAFPSRTGVLDDEA